MASDRASRLTVTEWSMLIRRKLFLAMPCCLLAVASINAQPVGDHTVDRCTAKVPDHLQTVIHQRFPSLRIAGAKDESAEDMSLDERYGGDGCFTVARGNFDGRSDEELAVLLVNDATLAVHLVVALRKQGSWATEELPTWCGKIPRCYVKRQGPGRFDRSAAATAPLGSNERETLQATHDAILSGTLEATGVAYVYENDKWFYVWVAD